MTSSATLPTDPTVPTPPLPALQPVVRLRDGATQAVLLVERGAGHLASTVRTQLLAAGRDLDVLAMWPGQPGADVPRLPAGVALVVGTATMCGDDRVTTRLAAARGDGGRILLTGAGLAGITIDELRRLPIDGLVLPEQLVSGIGADRQAASTVLALVCAAEALGHRTIATGVDDRDVAQRVRGLQLDAAAGAAIAPTVTRIEDLPHAV